MGTVVQTDQAAHGQKVNKNRPGVMANMRSCAEKPMDNENLVRSEDHDGVLHNLLKEDEQWTVHENRRVTIRTLWEEG